jgi:hypothetical protein
LNNLHTFLNIWCAVSSSTLVGRHNEYVLYDNYVIDLTEYLSSIPITCNRAWLVGIDSRVDLSNLSFLICWTIITLS